MPEEEVKVDETAQDHNINEDIKQDTKHEGFWCRGFKFTCIIIVEAAMVICIVALVVCVVVLFSKVYQFKSANEDLQYNMSVLLNTSQNDKVLVSELIEILKNQSKEISNLQKMYASFVASPQEFIEEKIEALRDELADKIFSYHHITSGNVTAVTGQLSELEDITATIEQKISYINKTTGEIHEDVDGLSTRNEQIVTQLQTLNDSVELIDAGLQKFRGEVRTNLSEVHSSMEQFESQLRAMNQRIDRQNGKVSALETEQASNSGKLNSHENRIGTLEANVAALGNSATLVSPIMILLILPIIVLIL